MLRDAGAPWEDLPLFFRSGTFVARAERLAALDPDALARIPERHRPAGPVLRSAVTDLGLGSLDPGPARDAVRSLLGCTPGPEPGGAAAGDEAGGGGDSDGGAA